MRSFRGAAPIPSYKSSPISLPDLALHESKKLADSASYQAKGKQMLERHFVGAACVLACSLL